MIIGHSTRDEVFFYLKYHKHMKLIIRIFEFLKHYNTFTGDWGRVEESIFCELPLAFIDCLNGMNSPQISHIADSCPYVLLEQKLKQVCLLSLICTSLFVTNSCVYQTLYLYYLSSL